MPSSRPSTIPTVLHLVRQLRPNSILDVGVGFGKWGHLFREYTDIVQAEYDPPRYQKANWQVRIDGIEGHAPYLTPMHEYIYDRIYVGDAMVLMKTLARYDLIFLGDIIEHFEKEKGIELLREACANAQKAVIACTPKYETAQDDLCANPLEKHRSLWSAKDFRKVGLAQVKTLAGNTLLAVFRRDTLPKLNFQTTSGKQHAGILLLQQAREELLRMLKPDMKLILVDDEQIRGTLRHKGALPFLERDGHYWGPPEGDKTAINELERMRKGGAQFVVFVPSTFWWLEHYPQFAEYLHAKYKCLRKDSLLIAYDLG